MNQPSASPTIVVSAQEPAAAETRLRGRWLFLARAGWIVLTLLILTLSAIALPRLDALAQSICQPGAQCLSVQLTQADLRLLHQLGLSPGFLAAYQAGLDVGTVLIYSVLATLIFWRRSQDRMALFCAYMLVLLGGATYTGLLDYLRPVAPTWYWLVGVLELLAQVSFLTFFLLFPTGRFVPRWTRWGVLVAVLLETHYVFLGDLFHSQVDALDSLGFAAFVLSLVGLQVYRYRRISTFRERQQTKWVVFGFSIAVGSFALSIITANIFIHPEVQNSQVLRILTEGTVLSILLLLIPISIAFAILRSHLYDIDTLINRALVYGLLTGLLAAIYAGLIIGLESLVGVMVSTGQPAQPVIIVISTLVIAALFQPLRARLQTIIDRRFYRKKYDAEKLLAAFSTTLRNEVDLNELRDHLLAVVQETMQPTHVSLWLLPPERRTEEQAHRLEPPGQVPPKAVRD